MRWLLAAVFILGCGGHDGGAPDGGTTGDGSPGDGDQGDGAHGGTTVHLTLTNRPDHPDQTSFLVAYQDGAGPWQVAPAPNGDTYALPINSPSYGVAWTCVAQTTGQNGPTSLRQVTEAHFAITERTDLTMDVPPRCTDRAPQTVALTGTVQNRESGYYVVNFGDRTGIVTNQGTFHIETPPGTHDVVLRHLQFSTSTSDYAISETVVDRGIAVTGPTQHDLDASLVVATQSFNVDVQTSFNTRVQATTLLYSAGGTNAIMNRLTNNFESVALDPTEADGGDVYDQQIQVSASGQTAIVTNATSTPSDQTFTAPTPLGDATSQVASMGAYPMITTTWAPYDGTNGYQWVAAQQPFQGCGGNTGCTIVWSAFLSPGVTGASPGYQMPDLSGLTGWDPALAFIGGSQVTGYAEADMSTGGTGDFPLVTPPPAGTQRTIVRSAFTVTP
jgi:hypothetical protein